MGLTEFTRTRLAARRSWATAAIAATGAITMAFVGVAPAASAAPNDSSAPGVQASASEEDEVLVAFAELRQLIDRLQAEGEMNLGGAHRVLAPLGQAEFYYDLGYDQRAVLLMNTFKRSAQDPFNITDVARVQLIAAADELIVLLRASA